VTFQGRIGGVEGVFCGRNGSVELKSDECKPLPPPRRAQLRPQRHQRGVRRSVALRNRRELIAHGAAHPARLLQHVHGGLQRLHLVVAAQVEIESKD